MEKLNIGYMHSGKIQEIGETFLKIAKERNLDVTLLDVSKIPSEEDMIAMQKCDIIYNDSGDEFSINFVKIFEEMGINVLESSKAMKQENKWNFSRICEKNNIPTPRTILLDLDIEKAKAQLTEFNEWPLILKRVRGTWGEFVEKANNLEEAESVMKKFWEKGSQKIPILAQEFINSFSYRVTYIDKEILQTAIKENNNWKCTGVYARNFKRFDIDPELKEIVNKIMNSFDIKICGIDLLKRGENWVVIEVNTEPAIDFFQEEEVMLTNKIIELLIKTALENRSKRPLLIEVPIKVRRNNSQIN